MTPSRHGVIPAAKADIEWETPRSGWKDGAPVEDERRTSPEGQATRTPFALPQQILREHLDDFVLVSEEQIRAAQRTMIEATRNLV